jgi:two-component system, cell cycle sensor histidine kinase PleC
MTEKRILLAVDDEPYILRSIEDLFEDDFKLLLSGDAEEALRMLNSNEVAVILSDQRMPGWAGICSWRKREQFRGPPAY